MRPSLFAARSLAQAPAAPTTLQRFSDTLVVAAGVVPTGTPLTTYAEALRLFQREEYDSALVLLQRLTVLSVLPDSLADEALFHVAECMAALGRLSEARSTYKHLLRQPDSRPSLRERLLLRLGHLACAESDLLRAQEFFSQLRREFPQSRYLPLATCAAIRSPMLPR
ncbi:MAG: tetratricopeptide repeat protein [Chlorobiota bacterium]